MTCDSWWLWLLLLWTNNLHYLNYWVSLGRFYLLDIHCDCFLISPLCGVAQTPDCGMLVIHLLISPLCGVAQTPDCGMPFIPFIYKPFLWCLSDARLRHASYFYPFEASLQTPDRCSIFLHPDCFTHDLFKWSTCVHHEPYFITNEVIMEYFKTWLSMAILYMCS